MEEYSNDLEKNLEALGMEVQALNAMRNDLLKRVAKEESRGLQVLPEVKEWVSVVEEIESKASRLLDKSISELQKLSKYDDISQIPPTTLHYSEAVCMTLKDVETHKSKGVFKELVQRAPLSHLKKMLPLQKIASREMLLDKAWKCLVENGSRALCFYGMTGVGKTTLLTQVKNKFIEVGDVSSLVIFVVVKSEEVEGLQDEIGVKLGLYGGQGNKQEKASEIFKFLSRKRFVLLLDGMQRKVDLEEIGVPLPGRENGCKIVFTTHSQEACGSQWIDVVEEVKCLSTEESWDLFHKIVGETTLKSHPDIPLLARIVSRKCGGLPITLDLIGKIMSSKTTVREWHQAIHVLVSSTAGFSARQVPILKFTYDNLPGEDIKSCFLYCALFPKNSDISKQDLVDYWIGEGIIEEENREIAEIKGYEMIGDLVRTGLLMENESGYGVKMHNMILEMALWVASDSRQGNKKFVVNCGERIHEMPVANDWNRVIRMSVISTRIETISGSPRCSELTTLFLQNNDNLKRISGEFFRWMTSLVVLNLSGNRELSELPDEVSSLVSLQFLNLSWTGINRLPLDLKELKRLIHLDLDYTYNLKEIEVVARLMNLQVLRLFWSVPMNLGLMEDVQEVKCLKELSLTVVEDSVFKRLLSSHGLASYIRCFRLENITITDGVMSLLKAMFSLVELDIFGCNIPEIAIDWRSTIKMETVYSGNIEKILQFRSIRTVSLNGCNGLRDLTCLLVAPNLDDLILCKCPQIKEVISREKAKAQLGHTSEQPFQNLTRLSLNDLPELESIYWTPLPFPVLEYIQISDCPKLRRLPFNSESAKGNQVRLVIDEECIKGVEWEDESTKQSFSDLNNRDFPQMAEEHNMDGLASEWHPVKNKFLVSTADSGESAPLNSIIGEKVFHSGKHAASEITGSEVVTKLVYQLFVVSRTSNKCRGIAENLATMLDSVQATIKEIQYSGVRLSVHRQIQLRMFFETLEKCRKLTDKVLRCKHWNRFGQLYHHRKMESLEKTISSFIRGPMLRHILADIHGHQVALEGILNQIDSMNEQLRSMHNGMHNGGGALAWNAINTSEAINEEMVTDGIVGNLGVGLELGKKKVKEMIFNGESLIGISGMYGSGKTTLAKEIERDKEVLGYFENGVFFLTVSLSPYIEELRAHIWRFLSNYDPRFGITIPSETRKLVILDDVCTRESLDRLMFKIPGLTTLVVSRSTLTDAKITYDVKLLNEDDATSLFCLFAFGQISVPSGFSKSLVEQVVKECKGLPLSLKVVGASLKDRSEKYWEGAAQRLSKGEPADEIYESRVFAQIEATLKTLNLTTRECFMDMGAFPEDMKIPLDVLISMWVEMHNLEDAIAFAVLVDLSNKNLLTLVKDPRFGARYTSYHDLFVTQHGVLRNLALHLSNRGKVNRRERLFMPKREPVLPREWERSNDEPYNARVVSIHTGEMNELDWFDMDLPKAEVLILNFTSDKYALAPFIAKMGSLRVLVIINNGTSLAYLYDFFIYTNFAKLRSLWLERVHVPEFSSCTVPLKNLHKMSLILCKINNSFDQTALEMAEIFPNLSDLTIDHCNDLVELSSTICGITSLKSISITNCPHISEFPKNLSKLLALQLLRLYGCPELRSLPIEICELPSLKYLDISQCVSLSTLPKEMGKLRTLEKIDMRGCRISSIPSSAISLATLLHVICDKEDLWMWEEVKKAVPGLLVEAAEKSLSLD